MVRDPVDRFVSLFNFLRTEHRWKNQEQKPPKEWFEKDINKCILSGEFIIILFQIILKVPIEYRIF